MAEPVTQPHLTRSVLFVSAIHTTAIQDALASSADLVCLDMEDGVPPDRKVAGRETAFSVLRQSAPSERRRIALRVNCLNSSDGLLDLLGLCEIGGDVQVVMPKIRSAGEVKVVSDILREGGCAPRLHCVIETCEGLQNAVSIAQSCDSVASLFFGGFDLSAALGVEMAWEPLQYARSRVVHAAALAGIDVLDAPHLVMDGADSLRQTTERCRKFGFTGRITKHLDQVAEINSVFSPTQASLEEAAAIVAQFEASPYSQIVVNGKVIELPAIRAMKRQ